ncbi:MAG: hypothetical protein JSU63_09180, partial [Phycisphaerales bacterium]
MQTDAADRLFTGPPASVTASVETWRSTSAKQTHQLVDCLLRQDVPQQLQNLGNHLSEHLDPLSGPD